MITGASAAAGYLATPLAAGRAPGATQAAPALRAAVPGREGGPERATPASKEKNPGAAQEKLTEEQKRQVQGLKSRDAEVRAHETAHSTAGGSYTSAPSFEFTTGPDGKRYATSGEVQIDSSPVRGNPEATIRKMDVVIRAATAPVDPSSQDLAVARKAQAERTAASSELLKSPDGGDAGGAAASPSSDPASASLALTALAAYTDQQKNDEAAQTASELANLAIFA